MSGLATRSDSKLMSSHAWPGWRKEQAHEPHSLALLPPARQAGGMAKPLAKLHFG